MKKKKYFEKLGVKVVKTMAQAALGVFASATLISQVDWKVVLSTAFMAGIMCILMNLSELKED